MRTAALPAATRGKLERVRMPAQAPKNVRVESADEVNEGKYVYCIIKSERPLAFGALGHRLASRPMSRPSSTGTLPR